MTRKFILPTILLHLGIIFRAIDHECYCERCHYIWHLPAENVRAAETRRSISIQCVEIKWMGGVLTAQTPATAR